MVRPWEKVNSEFLGDYAIFKLYRKLLRSPRTQTVHPAYVLEAPDWINIIPLTTDRQVVMIHQYRYGTDDITLEVPGGMVDAEDGDPGVAAAREMREETGYAADRIVKLGQVAPNPAFLNNACHTFAAFDAVQTAAPDLQGTEDIALELVPLARIPGLIASGAITHSLTIAAFYHLDHYLRRRNGLESP